MENNLQENQDYNTGTTILCIKHRTASRYLTSKNWFLQYAKTNPKIKIEVLYINFFVTTLLGEEDETEVGTVLGTKNDANLYPVELNNDLQEAQNDCADFT